MPSDSITITCAHILDMSIMNDVWMRYGPVTVEDLILGLLNTNVNLPGRYRFVFAWINRMNHVEMYIALVSNVEEL